MPVSRPHTSAGPIVGSETVRLQVLRQVWVPPVILIPTLMSQIQMQTTKMS